VSPTTVASEWAVEVADLRMKCRKKDRDIADHASKMNSERSLTGSCIALVLLNDYLLSYLS
jgi:hypothetical protein